jgi:hypothetical protein
MTVEFKFYLAINHIIDNKYTNPEIIDSILTIIMGMYKNNLIDNI